MEVDTRGKRPFIQLGICILVALVILVIRPAGEVTAEAWRIFAVFIAVIVSFIIRPFPMGMMVLMGLMTLVVTRTISIKESLSGFGNSTVWLVVAAFLLAGAMMNTGLGKRIALLLVHSLGKSVKGLAYAICTSEMLLGSVMPSNTARGGGIHAPIVNSLAHSLGSTAENAPHKAGQFLILTGAHANLITAAMFLTGMAANPLLSQAVNEVYGIDFGWGMWALGSIVPGIVALALLPQFIYWLAKPTITDVKAARTKASDLLEEMGPMTWKEKVMLGVLIGLLVGWSTSALHGLETTAVAMVAVLTLLITRAQDWEDILTNKMAWDTLVWLGGLLTMANMLLEYGFIQWFVDTIQIWVSGISGITVVLLLGIIYFYSMYGFSMLTAHIASMAAPFLAVCLAAGGQPYLAAAIFAYFSCLCGCMTNYSSGPIIIYFGLGYVTVPQWFRIGFIMSLYHLAIWLSVGMLWWKILGWY